jgi:DNA polymerase-3 subunit epsilon
MKLLPHRELPQDWDQFYSEESQHELSSCLQSFYYQPLVGSEQPMASTDFVAVDIETTGLNAEKDDIVSIGLVPFDYHRIYLAQAMHWIVGSRQLTSESIIVHGITHSEVIDAPSLRSTLPDIIPHLKGKQVVVHYRYMEREFFRQSAFELMQQNWLFPVIDTMELEINYQRRQQRTMAKWLQQPLPSLRLPNVRQRYHLPAYENHNALVDALATAELLQAQIVKQGLAQTPVRKLWY